MIKLYFDFAIIRIDKNIDKNIKNNLSKNNNIFKNQNTTFIYICMDVLLFLALLILNI